MSLTVEAEALNIAIAVAGSWTIGMNGGRSSQYLADGSPRSERALRR
jgi:hypothetical protein